MHERISIHSICFPGADLPALTRHWRELGARRVTLVSQMLLSEGLPAVQRALATGGCRTETIVHPVLPLGTHLDAPEDSWRGARETLSRVIESASTLQARSIQLMTGGHGALTWEAAAERFRLLI